MSELVALGAGFESAVKQAMQEQGSILVAMSRAKIIELANTRLHTTRAAYVSALRHFQVDENTFIVSLDASMVWREDGIGPHNMIDDLLKGKGVKRAADGSAYKIIPFLHKGGATQSTPAQATLVDTIKATLKQRKIPFGKIETDASGAPRLGLLHRLDIMNAPVKTLGPWGNSSLGHGPIGAVQQGPTGIPFLKGLSIYQRKTIDETGAERVNRSIVTFRIVSSKHRDQDRWNHPGLDAVHFFEQAKDFAENEWSKSIVPAIIDQVISSV